MFFLKAFLIGFAVTLGIELALGFCIALKYVMRSSKNERS